MAWDRRRVASVGGTKAVDVGALKILEMAEGLDLPFRKQKPLKNRLLPSGVAWDSTRSKQSAREKLNWLLNPNEEDFDC